MSVPTIEGDADPLVAQDPWGLPPVGTVTGDPTAAPAPLTDASLGLSTTPVDGGGYDAPALKGAGNLDAIAKSYLGVNYVYGGNDRRGIDCSGLVQQVYKAAYGIDLPRISYQQANGGKRISMADVKPGDLIAWDNSDRNPGADHIAVALGGGWIIEAPHPGAKVRLRKLDFNGYDRNAWAVTYR